MMLIEPTHNKKSFFKYYTPESGKLTLKHTTRKWSTPLLFNDPFDNQFDLNLEEPNEALAEKMVALFHENLTADEPIYTGQFGAITPIVMLLRHAHRNNPDFEYSESDQAELKEAMLQGMQTTFAKAPKTNEEVKALMADVSVFCLSETQDNLLMWSHYAHNHTGVVIEFLSLKEVDSPLILAQPVRYQDQMPRLNFEDMMGLNPFTRKVLDTITLTKSNVWEYEKEWRIISSLRDKSQTHEILPYAPEEVGAVYLGCKISAGDKAEVIDITKAQYPTARIFQAQKHPEEFRLIFTEET